VWLGLNLTVSNRFIRISPVWDVIFMTFQAIALSRETGDRLLFRLYRVPRDGHSTDAEVTTLKLVVGPGDSGGPAITILLPNED
jgi:hypothetical protein